MGMKLNSNYFFKNFGDEWKIWNRMEIIKVVWDLNQVSWELELQQLF